MARCLQAAEGAAGDPRRRGVGRQRPRERGALAGGLAAAMQSHKPRARPRCLCPWRTSTLRRASRSSTRR